MAPVEAGARGDGGDNGGGGCDGAVGFNAEKAVTVVGLMEVEGTLDGGAYCCHGADSSILVTVGRYITAVRQGQAVVPRMAVG